MAKTKRTRQKPCDRCKAPSIALFRVQVSAEGLWIFVCGACLELVKPGNPDYRYGGTWKSRKRH